MYFAPDRSQFSVFVDSNCCLEMLILVIGTVVVRSGMYLASVDGGPHTAVRVDYCVCVLED